MPPHSISWRSILILFSLSRLGPLRGLYPSSLPTKTLYAHTCYIPSPPHSSWSDHPNNLGEQYTASSSLSCSLLHSPNTLTLLGPNIFLSTLFPNALSLRFSLSVTDQVSHPHKTTSNITVLYILILHFGLQTGRQKILHRRIGSIPWMYSVQDEYSCVWPDADCG